MTVLANERTILCKQTGPREQFRHCAAHIKWLGFQVYLVIYYREEGVIKTEPHGRGVPSAILNGRSPLPGLPSCGLRPHSGRPGWGERPLSMAEGTPLPCGSII